MQNTQEKERLHGGLKGAQGGLSIRRPSARLLTGRQQRLERFGGDVGIQKEIGIGTLDGSIRPAYRFESVLRDLGKRVIIQQLRPCLLPGQIILLAAGGHLRGAPAHQARDHNQTARSRQQHSPAPRAAVLAASQKPRDQQRQPGKGQNGP